MFTLASTCDLISRHRLPVTTRLHHSRLLHYREFEPCENYIPMVFRAMRVLWSTIAKCYETDLSQHAPATTALTLILAYKFYRKPFFNSLQDFFNFFLPGWILPQLILYHINITQMYTSTKHNKAILFIFNLLTLFSQQFWFLVLFVLAVASPYQVRTGCQMITISQAWAGILKSLVQCTPNRNNRELGRRKNL